MKLRGKVNLALIAAFAVGLILAGGGAYKVLTDEAVDNSARDARIVMEQASAIRTYTAEAIRPLLESQMKVQFLLHAIPSFAAQVLAGFSMRSRSAAGTICFPLTAPRFR